MKATHPLITGSSGTVGGAAARALADTLPEAQLLLGTRHRSEVDAAHPFFDYEDPLESRAAFRRADTAFLLLPPGLSAVTERYTQLLRVARGEGVRHVIFMSVEGAESASYLPHAHVERVIRASGVPFTFLRPSYFMQNLTEVFADDIRERHLLRVPAGRAKFLWVDTEDIGRAVAAVLSDPGRHAGRAYTITGTQLLDFQEVAGSLSQKLAVRIRYRSPNPITYAIGEIRRGEAPGFALAKTLIHWTTRFQAPLRISADYTYLTGLAPGGLGAFIEREAGGLRA